MALVLAGAFGVVVVVAGIARFHPSWRRPSILSVVCGGLAWLFTFPVFVPLEPASLWYASIWLGGVLSLVSIGSAVAAFARPLRNRALDIVLAVVGLLVGIPCALLVLWILLLTISGSLGFGE